MTGMMTLPELRKHRCFQRLCKDVTRAISAYGMIEDGDRILVGISGGEDSLTLMHVLTALQRRSPIHFELLAATVDLSFGTFRMDVLEEYCRAQDWPFVSCSLDGQKLLREKKVEERPCALCSRLRRGKLHALADEHHCNKIALGQQLDDLCVSLLMALFRGAGLKTMAPNVPADAASKRLIRPLCTVTKDRIHEIAVLADYPSIKSCPYEEQLKASGDRFYLETLLNSLEKHFPHIRSSMLHSMSDVRLAHLLDLRYCNTSCMDEPDGDEGKL